MKNLILYILLIISLICSCKDQKNQKPVNNEELRETLIKANQIMAQNEAEEINSYIKRHELNLTQSGTGMRYEIIAKGNSNSPDEDDIVTVEYEMNLLNGNSLTDDKDTMQFVMGKADAPKGMEEGLRMIGEGGNVFLIIPSHLAYGRKGNEINVPGNTPVVLNATLINVTKKSN